ncbi:MAG: RnfABCDGE type electron transport complex subunit B [Desulfuromonadales bacterium]|nr:RnfABCDGE type electron transport complex subunit B [Desulfuromonadales bacterium]MDT8422452.1 RnfABCDGE type electron transport complex subunit B [Desulfuromonadales bacterium]
MLEAILSLGGVGFCAALALGFAAQKFAVEVDAREAAILEVLPGANCGACGFPGCGGYARAVASGAVAPELCPPGGPETVARIARIIGVAAIAVDPQVAVVICQGDQQRATEKYRYLGISDCRAAQKLADGPKTCPGGCLGLGTCAAICPFGAITMTDQHLAVIDRDKCVGCRKCVEPCPRQVIKMTPRSVSVHVLCNSHDKGALVRRYCQVGCIACQLCKKAAPEAYVIEDFLARVDYRHAVKPTAGVEVAIDKCPTHCIRDDNPPPAPVPDEKPAPQAA